MSAQPRYVGQSRFVRGWPWFMVLLAIVQYVFDERLLGFSVLFIACALLFAALLPWRFVVVDDGIGLWFGFGRRRFLPRSEAVVRVGLAAAVAYRGWNRRFGYPLCDGLVERRRAALATTLAALGFNLA